MPYRPAKPCAQAGCAKLTHSRFCAEHQAAHERRRGTAAGRGYDAAWRRVRLMVLAAEPCCRGCGLPATQVDHIVPISQGGARLDPANLQPLCTSCHAAKHAAGR